MKILIVDDNEFVRRGIAAVVAQPDGWVVCGDASDGQEALRKAQELHPDLVLLDVSMPGANGFEVAASIRNVLPTAKIVMISQHDSSVLLPRALDAGADACIEKDNLGTDLIPMIEKIYAVNR